MWYGWYINCDYFAKDGNTISETWAFYVNSLRQMGQPPRKNLMSDIVVSVIPQFF